MTHEIKFTLDAVPETAIIITVDKDGTVGLRVFGKLLSPDELLDVLGRVGYEMKIEYVGQH